MKVDISYKAPDKPVDQAKQGFFWKSRTSGRTYLRVSKPYSGDVAIDVLLDDPSGEVAQDKLGTLMFTTAVGEAEVLESKVPPGTVITITT